MVLDKQNETTAYPKNKLEFNFFSSPVTVEPQFNEGPRDWQTVFPERGFVISRIFSIYFTTCITGVKKIACYVEDFVIWGFITSRFHYMYVNCLDRN